MRAGLLLVSLAAGLVAAQDINTVPSCGQTCINNIKAQSQTLFACAPGDQKCLCDNGNYRNAVRDCADQSCGADATPAKDAITPYLDALCAAAAASPVASASSVPPASATPPPPAAVPSTTVPVTSAAPTPTPVPAPVPSPASTLSTSTTAAPAATTSSTAASSSATHSSSTSTSSTSTSSSSATTAPVAGASQGLSSGAKIGLGIGSAAVAAGLIGVLVCVFLHKRNKNRDTEQLHRLKISDPMPGSGRSYAGDHHNDKYEVNNHGDLDFHSRRYEDMVPRQSPRNMV